MDKKTLDLWRQGKSLYYYWRENYSNRGMTPTRDIPDMAKRLDLSQSHIRKCIDIWLYED